MARTPSQTEQWMMWGLLAGAGMGAVLLALTGNVLWVALLPAFGLPVGLSIGQLLDHRDDPE